VQLAFSFRIILLAHILFEFENPSQAIHIHNVEWLSEKMILSTIPSSVQMNCGVSRQILTEVQTGDFFFPTRLNLVATESGLLGLKPRYVR